MRATIEHCANLQVGTLTVFAFSSENWSRPEAEVSRLMELLLRALNKEAHELHENGICLRFIGDMSAFKPGLRTKMAETQAMTANNTRMIVNVAVNYGGRWDITQAAKRLAVAVASEGLCADDIDEQSFANYLALAASPDPDLLIRTGGEMRLSNFLLWQSAYTELYFTPVLWPDFDKQELDKAIAAYQSRERRYGKTGDQVRSSNHA